MENGTILVAMIVAAFAGRRNIILGCICGVIVTLIFYFTFNSFNVKKVLFEVIFGAIGSTIAATLAHIIFPGLKGGGHNSGPSYIGGGDRFSGIGGGIIHTDEELKNKKENEKIIP